MKCKQCKATLKRPKRGPTPKYCSATCRSAARYHRDNPRPKLKPCAECGEPFEPKRTDSNFCSVPCRSRYYSQRYQHRVNMRNSTPMCYRPYRSRASVRDMRERPLLRYRDANDTRGRPRTSDLSKKLRGDARWKREQRDRRALEGAEPARQWLDQPHDE